MDTAEIVVDGQTHTYTSAGHIAFVRDMKRANIPVIHFEGKDRYVGPAAPTSDKITRSDIIRASVVTLKKDKLGRRTIPHPG